MFLILHDSIIGSLSLTLWCPFWRSRWAFVIFVDQPVLFWIIQRIYHFGDKFVLFGNLKHCACVLVPSAVVCGGEDSEELSSCESLKSVHHTFMRSQDELCFVIFKEILDSVWAEFDDVAGTIRVTDEIGLDSKVLVAISWV